MGLIASSGYVLKEPKSKTIPLVPVRHLANMCCDEKGHSFRKLDELVQVMILMEKQLRISHLYIIYGMGRQMFSVKGWIVYILGFVDHTVCHSY